MSFHHTAHGPARALAVMAEEATASLLNIGDDVDPLERELACAPADLALEVEKCLKSVVREVGWTIKRRQRAHAIGFNLASEEGELDRVSKQCLSYMQKVESLKNWLMHAQAALLDELKIAIDREAKEAKEVQEKAEKAAEPNTKKEPEKDAGNVDAGAGTTETIDLTMEDVPAPANAKVEEDPPGLSTAGDAGAMIAPAIDPTAIIQQIIQNMPSVSEQPQTTASTSLAMPDMNAFDLGSFTMDEDTDSFDPGTLNLTSFDFDNLDFGGAEVEGLGGDLSSLDFSSLAGPQSNAGADFDLTSMIQTFDQATSRDSQ